MKVAVGSDHRGNDTIERVIAVLRDERCEVERMSRCTGKACDYPDMAYPVAMAVARGEAERGVLICGSGVGMCIAANKVRGVRAALAHDEVAAEVSRRHNDANVLCVAADLTSGRTIEQIVQTWIRTGFEGGRHARRNRKIAAIESGDDPTTVADEPADAETEAVASPWPAGRSASGGAA